MIIVIYICISKVKYFIKTEMKKINTYNNFFPQQPQPFSQLPVGTITFTQKS